MNKFAIARLFHQRSSRLIVLIRWAMVLLLMIAQPVWAEAMAKFEVVAKEGKLFPEQLVVPAGVKIRLTLRNEGTTPVEFENLALRVERIVIPDAAAIVILQPLKAGSYLFVDDFHLDGGKMQLIAK